MEQRQKESGSQLTDKEDIREDENKGRKSNHVSALQRNERQFYDNLLVTIYSFTMYSVPLNLPFCPIASLNALFNLPNKTSREDNCALGKCCLKCTGLTEKSTNLSFA